MPSSHPFQLNEITEVILEVHPRRLLDIGIGFGKFGFLAREYLELWDEHAEYGKFKYQIDGIEAFPEYITPLHRLIYNTIFTGDAGTIVPRLETNYDLILMIDVFEHFSREDGLRLLDDCRKKSRNILISVPKVMSAQEEVMGNPYEAHKFNWQKKDFRFLKDKIFIPNEKSLICLIGEDSLKTGKILAARRRRTAIIRILECLGLRKSVKNILSIFAHPSQS
jgi:hypothetical protein